MQYESTKTVVSTACPGVRFTITRMTFGRRVDLMRRVRHMSAQLEFENAGSSIDDRLNGSLTAAAIEELYLSWGLVSVEGLEIDGRSATPEALMLCGPESLCREIIDSIRRECMLTEDERKN